MSRTHVRALAAALVCTILRSAFAQPPPENSIESVVSRFVEGCRQTEWEQPAFTFTRGSMRQLENYQQLDPDDAALGMQYALLVAGGRRVETSLGTPLIRDDEATVPVVGQVDCLVELALRTEGGRWKVDLSRSRPLADAPDAKAEDAVIEALRPLPLAAALGASNFMAALWTTESREWLGLGRPVADRQGRHYPEYLADQLWVLWGTPDMVLKVGKPEVTDEGATVTMRKRFAVEHTVALRQEEGRWRVDLMRTAEINGKLEPGLGVRMLERKSRLDCLSNIKQIALALAMYVQDYEGTGPPADRWTEALMPYLRNTTILVCPAAPNLKCGYALRASLSEQNILAIERPAEVAVFFESLSEQDPPHDNGESLPPQGRHGGRVAVGYADGHAKCVSVAEARELLRKPVEYRKGVETR